MYILNTLLNWLADTYLEFWYTGSRELFHLWPTVSIYTSFLCSSSVSSKILQTLYLYPQNSGIEGERKFGASWYSTDSCVVLLPLVWHLTLPSLPHCSASPYTLTQFLQRWHLPTAAGLGKESHLMEEKTQVAPYSGFQTILFERLTKVWLIIWPNKKVKLLYTNLSINWI